MATPEHLAAFRTAFPEFPEATASDAEVNAALDYAVLIHTAVELAMLNCAAHVLVIRKQESASNTPAKIDGGARLVQSEGIGNQAQTYVRQARGEQREVFFNRTAYGRMFLLLEHRNSLSAVRVV